MKPADFYFVDASFTDAGQVGLPAPPQMLPAGQKADVSIEYSHLSSDPNASKGTGEFVYAPAGKVVATFR